jgi:signal transduction histidine kinase
MLIFFGVVLYGIVRYSFYSEIDRTLQTRASEVEIALLFVAEAREGATSEGERSKIETPSFDRYEDVYIELRMPNGGLSYQSTNLNNRELPLTREMLDRASSGEQYLFETELNHGEPIKLLSQPVFYKGQFWAIVLVGRSLSEMTKNLQRLLISIATGIGLALIAALVVGAWLAERALTPVDAVTQAALRISRAEDLTRRLPPYQSMDEIGRLIAAFNEMLGRLDDVFQDQQRFVADVSHELRTPLTALQGNIDLLKRSGLNDPQMTKDSLKIIESEVARLSRLVSDLLLLARADGGEKLVTEPVELDTLLLEVFVQGQALIYSSKKPIRLRLGHEDQATILGAPDRLKQLLLNLVDNAIKYTQEGEIILSLWKDETKNEVHITVQDTGIGISSQALPHLFRRFYRADKARSRKLGGTGLGLAIVHWIILAHQGHITVASEEGKGSTFTVILPLPTAQEIAQNKALPLHHANQQALLSTDMINNK